MTTTATASIVFFSGTGCTARSAAALRDSLERLGIDTCIEELWGPQKDLSKIDSELLVVMYPVYTFDAPLPIYEYIDLLEPVEGQHAAIIPVSGGGDISPNRACRLGIRRKLEHKGFAVIYESMVVMPCNVIVYTPEPAAAALLETLPSKCDEIASDLARGIVRRASPPLLDKLFSKIGRWEKGYWGRIRFSEKLHVADTCISCGVCAGSCPRENIDMVDGTPRFRTDCVMCLRCVYGCPRAAISAGYGAFLILKDGFSLAGYDGKPAPDESALEHGLESALWKGVRQYLSDKP